MSHRDNVLAFVTGCSIVVCSIAVAVAQTPPPSVAPTDNAIVHSPGNPSSPALESPSSQLHLTAPQRAAILIAIRRESLNKVSPLNFTASVGAPVPPSIELYVLPDAALEQVPAARIVKYTVLQNQIVLVDPTMMRVVDILRE